MHYFYGARAIDEVFFLEDFLELEKEFPNFHFHLALDRPDPKADALGVKYTPGFIAPVMGDTYLKQHDAPEDIALLVRSSYDVQDCAWLAPLFGRWGRFDDAWWYWQ